MNEMTKVMIAYDGSPYADAAIDDLRRAGLPPAGRALIVSVADVLVGDSLSDFETIKKAITSRRTTAAVMLLEEQAAGACAKTQESARAASRRVRALLPGWQASEEVLQGTPVAGLLLRKAAEWQPDLIVAGSHGRSAIGRFFLGSVSKSLAEAARCPVRIVRRAAEIKSGEPVKIIAAASSLSDAARVIEAVGGRARAGEAKLRLIAFDDGVAPGGFSAACRDAKELYAEAAEPLAARGLEISVEIAGGRPKDALPEIAENWKADSIFVVAASGGAAGLDETAAALITGAKCTVEVVR